MVRNHEATGSIPASSTNITIKHGFDAVFFLLVIVVNKFTISYNVNVYITIMKKEDVLKVAEENNGYIYSDLMKEYEIPTVYITRLVKEGSLTKAAKGVYIAEPGIKDEMYIMSIKYKDIVYSGETALFLNHLSNKQTTTLEVTVPYHKSSVKIENFNVIRTRKKTFDLGITMIDTPFGNEVKCYDKERCICDLFIRPEHYDYEDRIYAINEYSKHYLNMKKLYDYAKKLNVYDEVKNVFEVIGWN